MKIDAATQIFGIIGNPLSHTFSPAMHNAGFEAKKINAVYLAFPLKNLIQLKYSMKQWNIRGLSVTIPYKIPIRRLLDRIDPLALQIGSVNTILWGKTGLLEGYNTDGPGAIMALKKSGVALAGKRILVIGSGGSARSIAFALTKENPAEIGLMARNPMMAMQLARNLTLHKDNPAVTLLLTDARHNMRTSLADFMPQSGRKWTSLRYEDPESLAAYDLIINTTPMGMRGSAAPGQSPLSAAELKKHQTVFDIVYNPAMTPLLKLARKKRCAIVLGHKMLLYQGVLQFELFTGRPAPVEAMEKALIAEIKKVS
ncbi:MAG: shikimate dehydrogenase [Spirochaetes bacterium]|nr:shikimate dehydrogenase [Spirochaetota bacterium]MBX3721428.1 shikimate dehydrogenase [Turneriella sp.]